MSGLQETRARMQDHFAKPADSQGSRWSELWNKGDFLPWDRGIPNPALEDALREKMDMLGKPTKWRRALVPGCGRGYDVLLLASFGFDAYGLEVSEAAVRLCEVEKAENVSRYPDQGVGPGTSTFLVGDFFALDWQGSHDRFDLIYDYTFLCAIPPEMRPKWARRMADLLAPDGRLLCLEFPTKKDPKMGGPPFALPSIVYEAILSAPGETVQYNGERPIVREKTADAMTRVAHWQPSRTHDIGKDQDWMSVWRHC